MFGGFILNGYRAAIPALAPFANLTWFGWTRNHIPLAGQFDWAPLGLVAVLVVVVFAIGVEAFARRDLGATSADPDAEPAPRAGRRARADRARRRRNVNLALAWGIGIGLFGLVIAGSGSSFVDSS